MPPRIIASSPPQLIPSSPPRLLTSSPPHLLGSSPPRLLAWALVLLYLLDRLLKLLALHVFFRRKTPPPPAVWPTLTLLCPLTRSPNNLRRLLNARAALDYPGPQRCLLICDQADLATQALCHALIAERPDWPATLVLVKPTVGLVASKIEKLCAALPHADGELLCFVDDDVLLPPDALRVLVTYLLRPGVGAVFGLACYSAWGTLAESLMSGFVNTSALLSYVPISFLSETFTITGHCFAMSRRHFDAVGGLDGMRDRIDDDHELARRLRRHGLRSVQTPLIYTVENRLATLRDYHHQIRRWMLIPRQTMLPELGLHERVALTLTSAGALLPSLLALLALVMRRPAALGALGLSLASFVGTYALTERRYLPVPMPLRRWCLLPLLACVTPLHLMLAALGDATVRWRGQRLHIARGGHVTVLNAEEP